MAPLRLAPLPTAWASLPGPPAPLWAAAPWACPLLGFAPPGQWLPAARLAPGGPPSWLRSPPWARRPTPSFGRWLTWSWHAQLGVRLGALAPAAAASASIAASPVPHLFARCFVELSLRVHR
eukprot:13500186-Alexandrium_andersonii.AAC.1